MEQDCTAVVARSRELILVGQASQAVELLRQLPERARDQRICLLLADAYRMNGDFASARALYEEINDRGGDDSPVAAAVAWRLGQLFQQQGDPRRALEVYGRAAAAEADPVDQAWLLAGEATAYWLLGDANEALAHSRAAVSRAAIASDPQARAAAHIAMALSVSLGGDPATVDEEYARAAACATEAGDQVQLARIDVNRSHHLLADARFAEAVESAAAAGAAAETIGSAVLLAVALGNEAEGLLRLGRYDDAFNRCERALSLAGHIGTRRTAGSLVVLAQIHLRLGSREQARAALEQALRLHALEPDRQIRVPALASLALALLPEDVATASELAAEALEEARGSARLPALLAAGRTALARGETGTARSLADQAVEHARRRRERAWLAEALELRAATVDRAASRVALKEAHQIWQSSGAVHDTDRVIVQLSRLAPASTQDRLAARLALTRLNASGVLDSACYIEGSLRGRVRIVTFGRFEVLVDGIAVPGEMWQSRRARELLRLLVCRRGRAIPRMEICEALWPDDDPDRTAHRLSVLLSIVRGIVGSDALITDSACVALDPACVQVDVEEFLTDISDAVALFERGAEPDAVALLADAVDRYSDKPFADAPYDDETTALRDEAEAAFLHALRLLAGSCRRNGHHAKAAGYLRRLLGEDRYDENGHRSLIAALRHAGQHGQALRATSRYRSAMAEIGVRATA
ncbi:MAG: tetratricopeptide repeat protein [Propionibacteriaceae bacterium]